jgi:hypothetical protein
MPIEMEPDPNERPPFTEDYSNEQAIYRGHLQAITLRDISDLTYCAHEIKRVENPFARDVKKSTDELIESIFDGNRLRGFTETALQDSMRAYVYSGLEIDTALVHLVAQLAFKNKRWLRQTIEPTKSLVNQFVAHDIEDARSYGYSALRGLGILPTRLLLKA